jgi:crotonobetainyl-CoA:carnitine CoA-transferase CaiB-like acyl-CoA transferase
VRLERRHEVTALIEGYTGQRRKADLKALFGGRVPFGPVQDAAEIFADPHFAARGMLVEVEQPGSATPVTIAGVPVHLSATPGAVRGRAPRLGEHTAEVLTAAATNARA